MSSAAGNAHGSFAPRGDDPGPIDALRAVIPSELDATPRTLLLVETAGNSSCCGRASRRKDVVLAGDQDAFDELPDCVAAEANHKKDRRPRDRLDHAFEVLSDTLSPSGGGSRAGSPLWNPTRRPT